MAVEAFGEDGELVHGTADRPAGSGRVLEQEPGGAFAGVQRLLEGRRRLIQPPVETGAEVGADVEHDPVGLDRTGDLDGLQLARGLPDLRVRRGEVDQVDGMADDWRRSRPRRASLKRSMFFGGWLVGRQAAGSA